MLFEQFRDDDFADLYPPDGQPALSPVLLAFMLIFAAQEDLSDRAAAFNVAWQYTLHLPLSYRGFHHTVLSEFRTRILTHDITDIAVTEAAAADSAALRSTTRRQQQIFNDPSPSRATRRVFDGGIGPRSRTTSPPGGTNGIALLPHRRAGPGGRRAGHLPADRPALQAGPLIQAALADTLAPAPAPRSGEEA